MIDELSLVVFNGKSEHSKLHVGDVGTVVHVHEHGKAYEVEFIDGVGNTIALVTLEAEAIHPIGEGEVLHARQIM